MTETDFTHRNSVINFFKYLISFFLRDTEDPSVMDAKIVKQKL